MKSIFCSNCGDQIENGYAVNPEGSAFCELCVSESRGELIITHV